MKNKVFISLAARTLDMVAMGKGREVTEENGLKKVKKGSEKH